MMGGQTSPIRTKESGAVIMRSGSGTSKSRVRRLLSVMAAVGALLVSSGIALMATPPSALAGDTIHNFYVCKFVGKPGRRGRTRAWCWS
jgi:hypothetical protein